MIYLTSQHLAWRLTARVASLQSVHREAGWSCARDPLAAPASSQPPVNPRASQLSRWPICVTAVTVTYLCHRGNGDLSVSSCDGDLSVSAVMTTYLCHSCHGDLSVMLSYVVACDTYHLPMDRRSVCSLFTVCNDLPARFKSIDTLITTAKVLINYNKGNLLWINKLWLNNIKQSFLRKGPLTSATYQRCTRTKTFSYF